MYVSHWALVEKIVCRLCVKGLNLLWIQDYLSNRPVERSFLSLKFFPSRAFHSQSAVTADLSIPANKT